MKPIISATSRASGRRVLMLVTDAHGGHGGIAQYNRDVIDALTLSSSIKEVVVLPRRMPEENVDLPTKVHYDWRSAHGLGAYIRKALAHGLNGPRFDVIYCAHVNLMPVALLLSRARNVPLILAIYGVDAWDPPKGFLTSQTATKADMVVSISQLTLDRYLAWAKADRSRTRILPNAIHLEQYSIGTKSSDLVAKLGLNSGPIIMTLGRMAPEERYKGFDEILEVLPQLLRVKPGLRYIAAGDGGDRARLEEKARDLGVSHAVVFTGRVEEERKADYFRLADAYIMPSSGEGFGFVILEALACGVPVIASTADGTFEAIRGGELGLAVEPTDRAALLAAILAAIERRKDVPLGLTYFSFPTFAQRLEAALAEAVR